MIQPLCQYSRYLSNVHFLGLIFFGLDTSLQCCGDENIGVSHRVALSLGKICHLRWGSYLVFICSYFL